MEKLPLKRYPPVLDRKDSEIRYWKNFKSVLHVKEYAPITCIDFCSISPYDFCVSSGARVQIYSSKQNTLKKTISRFKEINYCASFRSDGQLLAAGDGSGLLQIFDLNSRAILRSYSGHQSAVRSTHFLPNKTQVVSTSDDGTVRIWDIPSQQQLHLFEHSDHVRASAVSSNNSNLILTGSYDHTVKLWDLRANSCITSFKHQPPQGNEAPVEAVLMFPGDAMILTAGGNHLLTWDLLGSSHGRLLHVSSNHQKTITSLYLNENKTRLLTGSLDHHVKIYNVSDYKVTHSIKYPAPVLSVALSPNETHLVAGMTTGLLSVRERPVQLSEEIQVLSPFSVLHAPSSAPKNKRERDSVAVGGTRLYFMRGKNTLPTAEDIQPDVTKKPKLKTFEKLLKSFEYGQALDAALNANLPLSTIVSLFEELERRGDGLRIALSNRDDATLEPVLYFLLANIVNPRYVSLLTRVFEMILEMYASLIITTPTLYTAMRKIRRKTREEIETQKELERLMGVLDLIVDFSQCSTGNATAI